MVTIYLISFILSKGVRKVRKKVREVRKEVWRSGKRCEGGEGGGGEVREGMYNK